MKLRHLEIFHAVMTCGSLSRAAEALNISQPAASKALKSAEMKLGFTLFQRVRGKLLPTSEAITLFEKAQSIYQDLDNLRLLADNLARDPRAKITLGCLPSLGLSLVPELVTDFYQQNSNLVMTLTTEHTETLARKLDLREIDLALTLQPVQQGEDPDHPDCRSTAGVHRPSLSSGGGGHRPDRPAALDLARGRTRSLPPSPPVATFPPPGLTFRPTIWLPSS
ncbi:transcriptional activator protein LysR [Klebsiella variicola]|uniref:Transcriptional activator protein LysR n=1 Tax=Klebsiella variicola TaxID=244366 RepID=A0A7H4MM98_KLEVA|nr:transcriptional activator protein LysR [Klebsiella variicola]